MTPASDIGSVPPEGRRLPAGGVLLCATLCGFVDACSLMRFGVYSSFMSGQTASTGTSVGQAHVAAAAHDVLPIPFFVVGLVLGLLVQPDKSRQQLSRVFLIVAGLLAMAVGASFAAAPPWFLVMVLALAMGFMNTTVSRIGGQAANVGFVTGDLKNLAEQVVAALRRMPVPKALGAWDTHWWRAATLGGVWSAFLIGAVLGAVVASRIQTWALLLPVLAALFLAATARPVDLKA